jgi:alpha-D-xyloside xylohydrolase
VRWFQWGAFQPVMRAHGERMHNEVWSYGKQAEPILEKYLRLRYQLMPYTYSQAYRTYQTGALRSCARSSWTIPRRSPRRRHSRRIHVRPRLSGRARHGAGSDQPQGLPPRRLRDWYNYWTNERIEGGQTITAAAPIDTIPLFVRAGSIVPLGSAGPEYPAAAGNCVCACLSRAQTQTSHSLFRRRNHVLLREGVGLHSRRSTGMTRKHQLTHAGAAVPGPMPDSRRSWTLFTSRIGSSSTGLVSEGCRLILQLSGGFGTKFQRQDDASSFA